MLDFPEAQALTALTQFMKSVIALFEALNQLNGHESALHKLFGEAQIELLRATTREGLHRVVGGAPDTRAIAAIWARYQEISEGLAGRNGHQKTDHRPIPGVN